MEILFFIANVFLCLAYAVRNILWLRLLAIIAGICSLPYFYFQAEPLYSVLFWEVIFILVNAFNIIILIMEQRAVYLDVDQKYLHAMVFSSLSPQELLKLLSIAKWREIKSDEVLIKKGSIIDELFLIFHGIVKVQVESKFLAYVKNGGFVGEMSYISGEATSADVIAMETTRYLSWSKTELDKLLANETAIKNVMQQVLSRDMVGKLRAGRNSSSE
jgi:CRP-like cAMP-binding protein